MHLLWKRVDSEWRSHALRGMASSRLMQGLAYDPDVQPLSSSGIPQSAQHFNDFFAFLRL